MKRLKFTAILLVGVTILALGAITIRSVWKSRHAAVTASESSPLSKVDLRILRAQQKIAKAPGKAEGYNELASAYMLAL